MVLVQSKCFNQVQAVKTSYLCRLTELIQMEKGSKRAGADRGKGNFAKKDGRTGGNKSYNKGDGFGKSRGEESERARPARKSASFGDERPKRTFKDRGAESDRPRKQWEERQRGDRGDAVVDGKQHADPIARVLVTRARRLRRMI